MARKFTLTDPSLQVSASTLKMRMLKKLHCGLRYEKQVWAAGAKLVAGVDEVGRGSLFGPVVAAAVILNPQNLLRGLRDSKLLPQKRREILAARIRQRALAYSIAAVDAETIDRINIYQASRMAMLMAVQQLPMPPDHLLIDALKIDCDCPQTSIIHGDALSVSIAAASIIAKVERDRMMCELDPQYPLKYLVLFLIVVAVGGLGRVTGVFYAALIIGMLDFVLKIYLPQGGTVFIYGMTILLLLWRPQGLFGRAT